MNVFMLHHREKSVQRTMGKVSFLEWFKGGRRDLDIVAPGQDVKPNPRLPLDFPLSHQDLENICEEFELQGSS
jgi:hypothetical protein